MNVDHDFGPPPAPCEAESAPTRRSSIGNREIKAMTSGIVLVAFAVLVVVGVLVLVYKLIGRLPRDDHGTDPGEDAG